eukprot:gene9628-17387_t
MPWPELDLQGHLEMQNQRQPVNRRQEKYTDRDRIYDGQAHRVMQDNTFEGVRSFFYPLRSVDCRRDDQMTKVDIEQLIKEEIQSYKASRAVAEGNYERPSAIGKLQIDTEQLGKEQSQEPFALEGDYKARRRVDEIKSYQQAVAESSETIARLNCDLAQRREEAKHLENELNKVWKIVDENECSWQLDKKRLEGKIVALHKNIHKNKQDREFAKKEDQKKRIAKLGKARLEVVEVNLTTPGHEKIFECKDTTATYTANGGNSVTEETKKESEVKCEMQKRKRTIQEKLPEKEEIEQASSLTHQDEIATQGAEADDKSIIKALLSDMEGMKAEYESKALVAETKLKLATNKLEQAKGKQNKIRKKLKATEIENLHLQRSIGETVEENAEMRRNLAQKEANLKEMQQEIAEIPHAMRITIRNESVTKTEKVSEEDGILMKGEISSNYRTMQGRELERLISENKLLNMKIPKLEEINADGSKIMDEILGRQIQLMKENVELRKKVMVDEFAQKQKSHMIADTSTQTEKTESSLAQKAELEQGTFESEASAYSSSEPVFKNMQTIQFAREIYIFENLVHETVKMNRGEMQTLMDKMTTYQNRQDFQKKEAETQVNKEDLKKMKDFAAAFEELLNENKNFVEKMQHMSNAIEIYRKKEKHSKHRIERLKKLLEISKEHKNDNISNQEMTRRCREESTVKFSIRKDKGLNEWMAKEGDEGEGCNIMITEEALAQGRRKKLKRMRNKQRQQEDTESKSGRRSSSPKGMRCINEGHVDADKRSMVNGSGQIVAIKDRLDSDNNILKDRNVDSDIDFIQRAKKSRRKVDGRNQGKEGIKGNRDLSESQTLDLEAAKTKEGVDGELHQSLSRRFFRQKENGKEKQIAMAKGNRIEMDRPFDGDTKDHRAKAGHTAKMTSSNNRNNQMQFSFDILDKDDDEISLGEFSPKREKNSPRQRKSHIKNDAQMRKADIIGSDDKTPFLVTRCVGENDSQTNLVKIKKQLFWENEKYKRVGINKDAKKMVKRLKREDEKKSKNEGLGGNGNVSRDINKGARMAGLKRKIALRLKGRKKEKLENKEDHPNSLSTETVNLQPSLPERYRKDKIRQKGSFKDGNSKNLRADTEHLVSEIRYEECKERKAETGNGFDEKEVRFTDSEASFEGGGDGDRRRNHHLQKSSEFSFSEENYDCNYDVHAENYTEGRFADGNTKKIVTFADNSDLLAVDNYHDPYVNYHDPDSSKSTKNAKKCGKKRRTIKGFKLRWVGFGSKKSKKDRQEKEKKTKKNSKKEKNKSEKSSTDVTADEWEATSMTAKGSLNRTRKENNSIAKNAAEKNEKLRTKEKKIAKDGTKVKKQQAKLEKRKRNSEKKENQLKKKEIKAQEKMKKQQRTVENLKIKLQEEGNLVKEGGKKKAEKLQAKVDKKQHKAEKLLKKRQEKLEKEKAKLEKKEAKLQQKQADKLEKERVKILKAKDKHSGETKEKYDDKAKEFGKIKRKSSGKRFQKSKRGFSIKFIGMKPNKKKKEKTDQNGVNLPKSVDENALATSTVNGNDAAEKITCSESNGSSPLFVDVVERFCCDDDSDDEVLKRETVTFAPLRPRKPIDRDTKTLSEFANAPERIDGKNAVDEILVIDTGEEKFDSASDREDSREDKHCDVLLVKEYSNGNLDAGGTGISSKDISQRYLVSEDDDSDTNIELFTPQNLQRREKDDSEKTNEIKEPMITCLKGEDKGKEDISQQEIASKNLKPKKNARSEKIEAMIHRKNINFTEETIKHLQEKIFILEAENADLKRCSQATNKIQQTFDDTSQTNLEPLLRDFEKCLAETTQEFVRARQEAINAGIELESANNQVDAAMHEARVSSRAAQVARSLVRVAKEETEAAKNEANTAVIKVEEAEKERNEYKRRLEEISQDLEKLKKENREHEAAGHSEERNDKVPQGSYEEQRNEDETSNSEWDEPEQILPTVNAEKRINEMIEKENCTVEAYDNLLEAREEELHILREHNAKLQRSNESMEARLLELETAEENFCKKRQDILSSQNEVEALRKENSELKSSQDSLQGQVLELEVALQMEESKVQIDKKTASHPDDQEYEAEVLANLLEVKEQQLRSLQENYSKLQSNKSTSPSFTRNRISKIETEYKELKSQEENVKERQLEIEIREQALETSEKEIELLKNENSELKSSQDSLQGQVLELEVALQMEESKVQIDKKTASHPDDQEYEAEVLANLLEVKEQQLRSLQENYSKLQSSKESMKERLLELEINQQVLHLRETELSKIETEYKELKSQEENVKERQLEIDLKEQALRSAQTNALKGYSEQVDHSQPKALESNFESRIVEEKEVQILKESNERLKNENQVLWADVSKLESQLESMRVTLEYFQEQGNEQASTGNQLGEKEVQVLKESNDRLKNENQVLWADVSKLESQLESMRVTLEYLQEQGNEQANTGNQLGEKEVQVLKESNDRLKNENQVLWADVSKLESQLESMRVTLEYFQEQGNEQASTGNQLGEKEVQVLKESNDRLKNENQVLWADVSKLESQLESMRVTLEYFQEQGNEQASTGNQLGEKEVQVLKEFNDRLKNENQVLWADVSKLESQLESMRVTLEYFQEQANEQASTGNQLEREGGTSSKGVQ